MVGNYERGENIPSIDVVIRIANAFQVSIDFLLGVSNNPSFDKEMIKRLDEVEKLPQKEKQLIFHYMDLIIRDYKTKTTYGG